MCDVIKLRVKDFGPIAGCYNDDPIEISKYTVFIGNQGTGKSSLAKLYSLFTWLEKALLRGDISKSYLESYSRFKNKYCAYHRIDSYLKAETELDYWGLNYDFHFSEKRLEVHDKELKYGLSKVMYVPAERNFLSVVEKPSFLKNLPESLTTFLEEFENAKSELKTSYMLPINFVSFEYDKLNKISWIKGSDYKLRLSASSSGFQSVVPLCLVTKNLAELVTEKANNKVESVETRNKIKKEVEKILSDKSLNEEVRNVLLKAISSRFTYSYFVNIVEEMEQNLYPQSQKSVLFELLKYSNQIDNNRLVLTTHSPYILNYLTLAAKAYEIKLSVGDDSVLQTKLSKIVPLESCIKSQLLKIYEIKDDGTVTLLETFDDLPSDDNFLNNQLMLTNDMFDSLLEIEDTLVNDEVK